MTVDALARLINWIVPTVLICAGVLMALNAATHLVDEAWFAGGFVLVMAGYVWWMLAEITGWT